MDAPHSIAHRLTVWTVAAVLAVLLAFLPVEATRGVVGATGSHGVADALTRARVALRAPAATAAIVHCGRLVWSGGSGSRILGSKAPVTSTTPFVLASTTKTITATMILRLVQDGKLSLDEPLSHFYPKLPNAAKITVRELLNHTSGLSDYLDNSRLSNVMDTQPRHHWTRGELLAVVRAKFPPGSEYQYSNTNYVVLGGIIEQRSGLSVEHFFRATVGDRVGMHDSTFVYAPAHSSRFARPYTESENGALHDQFVPGLGMPSSYWGEVWTDGGLASTAPDLARFLDGLFAGRMISARLLREMTLMAPNNYGFGIYSKRFGGHSWIGHDGTFGGYESEDWHDPKRNVTITLLTDLTERDSAKDTTSDTIWRAVSTAFDGTPEAKRACR